MDEQYFKYLKSIARQYPTIAKASTEIINLASILNLPKGTEHFLTDIHGEYEQFLHILKNGSGSVKRKIEVWEYHYIEGQEGAGNPYLLSRRKA